MSTPSSRRPRQTASGRARQGAHRRNIHLAAVPAPSRGDFSEQPGASPDLPHESIDDRGWDERVARALRHQEVIEASFDRAEDHARLGDFESALEWLDRADALSGGLAPGYAARRASWARAAAFRPQPAAGDWHSRVVRSEEGAAGR